ISISRFGRFLAREYRREDLAAAAQHHLESIVLDILRAFLTETRTTRVLLAGGVFGDVKLNQRVNARPARESVVVHPGVGDEGLPVGAALASSASKGVFRLQRIDNVFWGPSYGDREIEDALAASGLPYERVPDIEARIGRLLAQKKILARCAGAMEYGPRA